MGYMPDWRKCGMHASFSLTIAGALALPVPAVHALGLGQIRIHSAIGQPLRADIFLVGNDTRDAAANCFNAKLMSSDGEFIITPRISVAHAAQTSSLAVSTTGTINEPAATLVVEHHCRGQIQRAYQILLDPPGFVLNAVGTRRAAPSAASVNRQEFDDAPSASVEAGIAEARASRKAAQRSRASTAIGNAAQAPQPLAKSNRPAAKPEADVLRLSNQNLAGIPALDSAGLKLSITRSLSTPQTVRAAAEMQALRAAQAQFSAMLRDDGSGRALSPDADVKLQAMQMKIQALETQTSQFRQSIERNGAALAVTQKQRVPMTWVAGLAALLLASFAAIAWLIWRVSQLKANSVAAAWEENMPAEEEEKEDAVKQPENHVVRSIMRNSLRPSPSSGPVLPEKVTPLYADDASYDSAIRPGRLPIEIPKVEEISDVMQQAEFWMLMQNSQRAIEILEEYSSIEPPSTPLPWLYLFDLYRSLGYQQKYEILFARYIRIFNGKIPRWEDQPDADQSGGLEELPHLVERITSLWQSDNVIPFLENILIDDRGGMREGFNLRVYRDILFLLGVAYEIRQTKKHIKPVYYVPRWELAS
jgi:pilus assembly protein FimV